MELVFQKKAENIILILFSTVYIIAFSILVIRNDNFFLQYLRIFTNIIIFFLLIYIFLYQQFYNKKVLKLFKNKEFRKLDLIDRAIKKLLFFISIILFIILLVVNIFTKFEDFNMTILVIVPLLLSDGSVYVGENIIIYNNRIFHLNRISKYEKENKKSIKGIRFWINKETKLVKFNNKIQRDKFINILNNSPINHKKSMES